MPTQPPCKHAFLPQTSYGALPPLYFLSPLLNLTLVRLEATLSFLLASYHPISPPSSRAEIFLSQDQPALQQTHAEPPYITHPPLIRFPSLSDTHLKSSQVLQLRQELTEGMSLQRRQQVRFWIESLTDVREKECAELYLVRYKGFMMDDEGRVVYGIGDREWGVPGWLVDDENGERDEIQQSRGGLERWIKSAWKGLFGRQEQILEVREGKEDWV